MSENIDDLTGLPKLPEGQWWEVLDDSNRFDGYVYMDAPRFRVELRTTEPGPMAYKLERRHWWSRVRKVEAGRTTRIVTLDSSCVMDADVYTPEADEKRPALASGGATELTPEAILKTAERIARRRAKEQETVALLGKYPPKRLTSALA